MKYYIKADKFFLKEGVKIGGYLEVNDGKFGNYVHDVIDGYEIKDYSNYYIAPGLVDTHIHGCKGHDVMDADFKSLNIISEGLLETGVTSFLPTTLTADIDLLNKVAKLIGENYDKVEGAKIRGIFFEGPFFTEKYKGAQNPKYFLDPSIEIFENWQKLSNNMIKKIAIAPERKGAEEFIKQVKKKGVHIALGHSDATYEQATSAVRNGADIFVHTFNGMSGLHHREPGMVGAAMATDNTTCELICDGHHVNPATAKILIKIKTPDKVALITDCMRAGGMPEGDYVLGEFPVIVKDGTARLKESGSLAGSILKLYEGVHNVVEWNAATIEEAIKMGAYVPAKSVGIHDVCGCIAPDYEADFIVLDKNINLIETYVDGISRYKKK